MKSLIWLLLLGLTHTAVHGSGHNLAPCIGEANSTPYMERVTEAKHLNVLPGTRGGYTDSLTTYTGALDFGDDQLIDGEYFHTYNISATVGERIIVDLTSTEFDPFLVLIDPDEETTINDDYEGSTTHSRIEITADIAGDWTVLVTSSEAGQRGTYTLRTSPVLGSLRTTSRTLRGTLSSSDPTFNNGEHYDAYYINVYEGERIQAVLTSADFDTYLSATSSNGDKQENDDIEGSKSRSALDFRTDERAQWRIVVTSSSGGELGEYSLELRPAPPEDTTIQNLRGRLNAGDLTLAAGEYADVYYFQAKAGQTVLVEMTSSDFDTYVILAEPSGSTTDNNDFRDSKNMSRLEMTADEGGEWRVIVTSYQPGETGAYEVGITVY